MRDAQASEDTQTRRMLLVEQRRNGLDDDAVRHAGFCCESGALKEEDVVPAGVAPPRQRLRDEDDSVLPCLWDDLFAGFAQALFFLSS